VHQVVSMLIVEHYWVLKLCY